MKPFYAIGEFSQITGLSVKTLRFYHERGILLPSSIGRYSECGAGFSQLGRAVGRHICGKALCLYFDGEYRDNDANFEPCFPVRKEITEAKGVSIRELPGCRCLALIHRGPYDQLGRSYAKVLKQASERKRNLSLPTREVYLKGPGMIFKGNPRNYLTEIQLPLAG